MTMDSSAAAEVIEEPSDLDFSDESRPTSFRSAGVAVANFSSLLSLYFIISDIAEMRLCYMPQACGSGLER